MTTKKQRRFTNIKTKKRKKGLRLFLLSLLTLTLFGSLLFLFATLFDYLYPPVADKGGAVKRERWTVTLFFSDANERFLEPEKRQIPKGGNLSSQVEGLVKALLEGPKTNLTATFPPRTEVLGVKIDRDRAYINFNGNLTKRHPRGSTAEMATIYSLVNTICTNIPTIKEVVFLEEGKQISSLGGHIDTRGPFTLNQDMLAPRFKE